MAFKCKCCGSEDLEYYQSEKERVNQEYISEVYAAYHRERMDRKMDSKSFDKFLKSEGRTFYPLNHTPDPKYWDNSVPLLEAGTWGRPVTPR